MSFSEDDLLRRAVTGDRIALKQLFELHGPKVRQALNGRIPRRWQSLLSLDDVMQQTYLDAFLGIGEFDSQGGNSFVRWLTRIAEHNLIDAIRMLKSLKRGSPRNHPNRGTNDDSLQTLLEQIGAPDTRPSGHVARAEAIDRLRQAIRQLPEDYRRAVEMCDLEGRPVEDVATTLNRSVGALYMLLARARRRLKEIMGSTWRYFGDRQ